MAPPGPGAGPPGSPPAGTGGEDPDELLRGAGMRLADRVAQVLPGWLARRAGALLEAAEPGAAGTGRHAELASAAEGAGAEAAARLRELALTDLDLQRTTPLSAVRAAMAGPQAVLRSAGVPVPPAAAAGAPGRPGNDEYGLAPRSWAEVDGELAELALVWGAAKAVAHRRRHGT